MGKLNISWLRRIADVWTAGCAGLVVDSGDERPQRLSARHGPSYTPGADTWTYANVEGPCRAVEREGFAGGEFPWWNPYSSLGIPFAGQYENQIFCPLEWLEILCCPRVLNLLLLLKIYAAGVGCYLVLSRWLGNEYGALAGSVYYIYTPPFVWFYSMGGFLWGAVMLPWYYLGVTHVWDNARITSKSVGTLALIVGMSFLVGQPQIAGFNLLFLTIYALIKFGSHVSWRSLLKFALCASPSSWDWRSR